MRQREKASLNLMLAKQISAMFGDKRDQRRTMPEKLMPELYQDIEAVPQKLPLDVEWRRFLNQK